MNSLTDLTDLFASLFALWQRERTAQTQALLKISESLDSLSKTLVDREVEGPRWRASGYVGRALESLAARAPEDARINLARALEQDPSYAMLWVAMVWCRVVELRKEFVEGDELHIEELISQEDIDTALKALRYVSSAPQLTNDKKILYIAALFGMTMPYRIPRISMEASSQLGELIRSDGESSFERSKGLVAGLRTLSPREEELAPVLEAVTHRYETALNELSRQPVTWQTQERVNKLVTQWVGIVPVEALSRAEALDRHLSARLALGGRIKELEDQEIYSDIGCAVGCGVFVVLSFLWYLGSVAALQALDVSNLWARLAIVFLSPILAGCVVAWSKISEASRVESELKRLREQVADLEKQRPAVM